MKQHWMLQRLIGRAKQIVALEAAEDFGIEKDKRLLEVEEAIEMLKAGKMKMRKI